MWGWRIILIRILYLVPVLKTFFGKLGRVVRNYATKNQFFL